METLTTQVCILLGRFHSASGPTPRNISQVPRSFGRSLPKGRDDRSSPQGEPSDGARASASHAVSCRMTQPEVAWSLGRGPTGHTLHHGGGDYPLAYPRRPRGAFLKAIGWKRPKPVGRCGCLCLGLYISGQAKEYRCGRPQWHRRGLLAVAKVRLLRRSTRLSVEAASSVQY